MLLGYCAYYVVECMVKPLPDTLEEAEGVFDYLQVGGSVIPICQFPAILLFPRVATGQC